MHGRLSHSDPRLIVGYDKSDDACVYVVPTRRPPWSKPPTSFPPLWTIPFIWADCRGQCSGGVYAMGGEPKLALNILCLRSDGPRHGPRAAAGGRLTTVYEDRRRHCPADIPFLALGPFTAWRSPASACWATALRWTRAAAAIHPSRQTQVSYHPETLELADMGFLPAGAYRNRSYAESRRHLPPGDLPVL